MKVPIFSIIVLFIGAGLLLWTQLGKREKLRNRLLELDSFSSKKNELDQSPQNVVNYNILIEQNWRQRIVSMVKRQVRLLGDYALLKLVAFYIALFLASTEINERFLRIDLRLLYFLIAALATFFLFSWLKNREIEDFEAAFPDALNLLASAVSAGESIAHAIIFVGETLDNKVGKEFKWMGERLQMGENTNDVLAKACIHYPYPSFVFFIITIRANISRGGQLKQVIQNLNRIMFEARAADKKKLALTSESRASAKIVGAIPFLFLIFMQYTMPENFELVMFSDEGRPILYYVLGSEISGFLIIKWIMSGV